MASAQFICFAFSLAIALTHAFDICRRKRSPLGVAVILEWVLILCLCACTQINYGHRAWNYSSRVALDHACVWCEYREFESHDLLRIILLMIASEQRNGCEHFDNKCNFRLFSYIMHNLTFRTLKISHNNTHESANLMYKSYYLLFSTGLIFHRQRTSKHKSAKFSNICQLMFAFCSRLNFHKSYKRSTQHAPFPKKHMHAHRRPKITTLCSNTHNLHMHRPHLLRQRKVTKPTRGWQILMRASVKMKVVGGWLCAQHKICSTICL